MANLNNEQSNEMLTVAVRNGDFAALQSLVDEDGGNIYFKNEHGTSLLHDAAFFGSFPCVEFLLTKGINAIVKDNIGMTPLHYCVKARSFTNERTNIFQLLLDHGADIEEKCKFGSTPLMYASLHGSSDMVQFLLSMGANVNAKDNAGKTPLHYCASYRSFTNEWTNVFQLLFDHGADIEGKECNDGSTPLMCASVHGSLDMVQFLLSKGANVNAKNNAGNTPLHSASKNSKEDIACMLLDNGANLATQNTNGETALEVAVSDKTKFAILAHKLGMMSRDNTMLHQELQVLREDHQDVRNFIFAVFGNMDRTRPTTATTTTTTSDEI